MNVRPIEILLVEDNPDDVLLTREAFAESKLLNNLASVEDGKEALDYLNKEGKYADVVTPDLV